MYLIVGLGNPGGKYEKTRHNVGFMVLDAFSASHEIPKNIRLLKPQTMMNNSGQAVQEFFKNNKQLAVKNLVIVHDDIDLPLGKLKVSIGAGSAGHKGVESIIQQLGTQDFARLRIGVQPEGGKPDNVEDFVLQPFSQKERQILEQVVANACNALGTMLQDGFEHAMQEYN